MVLGILQRDGVAALINAATNTLPYSLQETVFAVAADLVLSDGYVTELEQKLFRRFIPKPKYIRRNRLHEL